MRKFIVSDIHGLGNIYNSIINYLDNVNKDEDVMLFINGDLIDHGIESADILLDVIKRIKENNFKIVYLGGNHEQLMYDYYKNKDKYIFDDFEIVHNWFSNGGMLTHLELTDALNSEEDLKEIVSFISNLDIYYKFDEKINNKKIVLVHASCPKVVKDICDLKISSDEEEIMECLWARNQIVFSAISPVEEIVTNIGNPNYFLIVGHSANNNKYGFEYNKENNYLNIDGGCSYYANGYFEYDHVPLVEVKDGYLKILTFNNNNEIIYGNYFDGSIICPMNNDELDYERYYLNKGLVVKKMIKLEDGVIGYEDWK